MNESKCTRDVVYPFLLCTRLRYSTALWDLISDDLGWFTGRAKLLSRSVKFISFRVINARIIALLFKHNRFCSDRERRR